MDGLRQWLRCLAGKHEWVLYEHDVDGWWRFCLYCGESESPA